MSAKTVRWNREADERMIAKRRESIAEGVAIVEERKELIELRKKARNEVIAHRGKAWWDNEEKIITEGRGE